MDKEEKTSVFALTGYAVTNAASCFFARNLGKKNGGRFKENALFPIRGDIEPSSLFTCCGGVIAKTEEKKSGTFLREIPVFRHFKSAINGEHSVYLTDTLKL